MGQGCGGKKFEQVRRRAEFIGEVAGNPDFDASPNPKYSVIRRAIRKMNAMEAGVTIHWDDLTWREYEVINIIQSKVGESKKNHLERLKNNG